MSPKCLDNKMDSSRSLQELLYMKFYFKNYLSTIWSI